MWKKIIVQERINAIRIKKPILTVAFLSDNESIGVRFP